MDNSSLANPISSFGNSFSTGFWSGGDWRWRWEGRRGWGTDMDHSWNSAVYPEFRGLQPYKEQKLRKRLYMPISYSSLTVYKLNFSPLIALYSSNIILNLIINPLILSYHRSNYPNITFFLFQNTQFQFLNLFSRINQIILSSSVSLH